MGCLNLENSSPIYRVEVLYVKGCHQWLHSSLSEMCGKLGFFVRRTYFVRRIFLSCSPYLPYILLFWSFFFLLCFPALCFFSLLVPPSILLVFLLYVRSFFVFNGTSPHNRYVLGPFFGLSLKHLNVHISA